MQLKCSHYSGCGNDFLIFDDRQEWFPQGTNGEQLIRTLCDQAAVDGCILLRTAEIAHFQMQFYNRDGTSAAMCGNGVRAFMRYLIEKQGWNQENCSIQINQRLLHVETVGTDIRVEMGNIIELGWNIPLEYEGKVWQLHHLNSGVPHLVIFVDDLESIDIAKIGAFFRYHPKFQPDGANVNFVDKQNYKIRTFERGVEAETLACGTGVTASAIALHKIEKIEFPIRLQVRSLQFLEIDCQNGKITMTGPANFVRDGFINFDQVTLQSSLHFHLNVSQYNPV